MKSSICLWPCSCGLSTNAIQQGVAEMRAFLVMMVFLTAAIQLSGMMSKKIKTAKIENSIFAIHKGAQFR